MIPINETQCSIPIIFYLVYFTFCSFCLLLIGLKRSLILLKISKRKTSKHHFAKNENWKQFWSMLTLLGTWICAFTVILITILPFLIYNNPSMMICLIVVHITIFDAVSERWLSKLIRLGLRIIPNHTTSSENGNSGDYLADQDLILKILLSLIRLTLFLGGIFSFLSILFSNELRWFQVTLGLHGGLVFLQMNGINWQSQRVINTIQNSQNKVHHVGGSGNVKIFKVIMQFRLQQMILFCSGFSGTIVYLLFAVQVIPITWILSVVTALYTTVTWFSVLATLASELCMKRKTQETSGLKLPPIAMLSNTGQVDVDSNYMKE
jgi:hypothetical protein